MKGVVFKMGVMDKFLTYMKLNGEEEEGYYDDDYLDDDDMDPEPEPRRFSSSKVRHMEDYAEDHMEAPIKKQSAASNITSIRQPAAKRVISGGNNMEVRVVKPTSVDDGRDITQMVLANRTVVLNLEGLDMDLAQRITDFVCGSCCAISGKLQKISNYILIITPASVDISGDYQDIFDDSFDGAIND